MYLPARNQEIERRRLEREDRKQTRKLAKRLRKNLATMMPDFTVGVED